MDVISDIIHKSCDSNNFIGSDQTELKQSGQSYQTFSLPYDDAASEKSKVWYARLGQVRAWANAKTRMRAITFI